MIYNIELFIELFIEFFKIGLFSIGGGAATIPYLYELAEIKTWFTTDQLAHFIAIAESTPGAIGVNMATFAGFMAGGSVNGNMLTQVIAAASATLGLVAPSVTIIIIISFCLHKFKSSKIVQYVFYGLRPASVALITYALYKLLVPVMINAGVEFDWNPLEILNIKNILIAVVLGYSVFKHKAHPLIFIILAAVLGIILKM